MVILVEGVNRRSQPIFEFWFNVYYNFSLCCTYFEMFYDNF